MNTFSYTIDPRPTDLGGSWRLKLLEDGTEVGGGVFPPPDGFETTDDALQAAFMDAQEEAESWICSR